MAETHDHHDHDHAPHGHAHDHDDPLHVHLGQPINEDELDPASRSLNEALRISFGVLKWIMVLIVVFFAFSGLREVKEGQVAVRVHLGAVIGEQGKQILRPGWHLAWPEPIDRIITIPTGKQQVEVSEAFWFDVKPEDKLKAIDELSPPPGGLNPEIDGSLLTADQNLVHGQWSVTFQIRADDAVKFVTNVALADVTDTQFYNTLSPEAQAQYAALQLSEKPLYHARQLVRVAAERAIVKEVAVTSADDFVRSKLGNDAIRVRAQRSLDAMGAGITLGEVLLGAAVPPLRVRDDFQAVSEAESDRAQSIENAQKEARQILTAVAGRAHEALVFAIDQYEAARRVGEASRIARAESAINALMDGQPAATALGPFKDDPQVDAAKLAPLLTADVVTGQVPAMIHEAVSYKTAVQASVQGEVKQFLGYYDRFKGDPQLERITRDRVWQDAFQAVLGGDVETFYLPSDPNKTVYLEAGRDPEVRKKRERQANRRQAEQAIDLNQPNP